MRKALLHPIVCLAACAAGFYLLRREVGVPHSSFWLALFLAACGYVCNLALIPWICLSDWGRMMSKKKMGDADVMGDKIYLRLMFFMSRYMMVAIVGGIASLWVPAANVAGFCAVLLAASATHLAWQVMRWQPAMTAPPTPT